MPRSRAADDFEAIRNRIEELRREQAAKHAAPANRARDGWHRGPCACGMSLFPDECDGSCKAL